MGMAILAGVALDWLLKASEDVWQRVVAGVIVVVFAIGSPVYQSWMLNFELYAAPSNPYVYGHTSEDVFEMVDEVQEAISASAEGKSTIIQVISRWGMITGRCRGICVAMPMLGILVSRAIRRVRQRLFWRIG